MLDLSAQYGLEVLVSDRSVTEYNHQGAVFIEGRKGSEFSLKISNNSYDPVLAIVAVDGINVLNGEQAGSNGPGYIIQPSAIAKVEGWTESNSSLRKFYFAGKGESYSERTERGSTNTGVVGVMFFRPKLNQGWQQFHNAHPFITGDIKTWSGGYVFGANASISATSNSFGEETARGIAISSASASNAIQVNSLGAGWGSQKAQNLSQTTFEKRDPNHPDALMAIYYDDRKGLERRGIVVDQSKAFPDPFPVYSSSIGCKPPTS